jgi:hypothetical protein
MRVDNPLYFWLGADAEEAVPLSASSLRLSRRCRHVAVALHSLADELDMLCS